MSRGECIVSSGIQAYFQRHRLAFECFCGLLSDTPLYVKFSSSAHSGTIAHCDLCGVYSMSSFFLFPFILSNPLTITVSFHLKRQTATLSTDYPMLDNTNGALRWMWCNFIDTNLPMQPHSQQAHQTVLVLVAMQLSTVKFTIRCQVVLGHSNALSPANPTLQSGALTGICWIASVVCVCLSDKIATKLMCHFAVSHSVHLLSPQSPHFAVGRHKRQQSPSRFLSLSSPSSSVT